MRIGTYTWVFLFAAMAVFLVIWRWRSLRCDREDGLHAVDYLGFEMNGVNIDGRIENTQLMKPLKVGLLICVTIQTGLYLRYHGLLTEYKPRGKVSERCIRRDGAAG